MLLDRYAVALSLRQDYLERRDDVAVIRKEIAELDSAGGGQDRADQLRSEIEEIHSAGLQEGEEESLNARYRAASNSRRLIELSASISNRLDDEECGAGLAIAESTRLLREIGRLDERSAPILASMERLAGDLDALVSELPYREGC